jgi:hypothetical protein
LPYLCSDDVPAVKLKAWTTRMDMFMCDHLNGPVPSLFNNNPDVAVPAMLRNKEKV